MAKAAVGTTSGLSGLRITAVATAPVGLAFRVGGIWLAVPGDHVIAYALPRHPG